MSFDADPAVGIALLPTPQEWLRLAFLAYRRDTGRLTGDMAPIPTALVRLPALPSSNPAQYPHEEWEGDPC